MIDWLRRVAPDRVFLKTAAGVWTYGDAVAEVASRIVHEHVVIEPRLSAGSVFDVVAGLSGGGVTVVGDGQAAEATPGVDLVVYTSGSSGGPKGVRLTKQNLQAASSASVEHLGHGSDDTWLLAMPLHHVGGLSIVVRSAWAGGSIRMLDGFDPHRFARSMTEDVTMVSVVPTMLSRLLDVHPGPYEGLRAVLVGGGPIPDGLLERAAEAGLPVLPTYGMTETFGQVATLRPGARVDRRAHPLPGVELRIGSMGVIQVRSPQVSPGYVDEADRADVWFTTGDLGLLEDDGALRVLGRADDVIITGGKKVDPGRVEVELATHPEVLETVVYGVPDNEWGQRVMCVVVGGGDSSSLTEWLRERLPGHMIPKEFNWMEEIPRTPMGKPDRALLRSAGDDD